MPPVRGPAISASASLPVPPADQLFHSEQEALGEKGVEWGRKRVGWRRGSEEAGPGPGAEPEGSTPGTLESQHLLLLILDVIVLPWFPRKIEARSLSDTLEIGHYPLMENVDL